jgi:hypothetical protein
MTHHETFLQSAAAQRNAAAEYRRLAALPPEHPDRHGADAIPLIQAARLAESYAAELESRAEAFPTN